MAYLRQAAQSSENSQRLQDSTAPEPLLLFWGVPYYDYRIICSIFWGFLIINVVEYWEFRTFRALYHEAGLVSGIWACKLGRKPQQKAA